MHELDEPQQKLQRAHVPLETVPQVDVLHLRWRGCGEDLGPPAAPQTLPQRGRPPRTFTATSVPSWSLARCTWARLAAATGW